MPPMRHCIFPSAGVAVGSNRPVDELAADTMFSTITITKVEAP